MLDYRAAHIEPVGDPESDAEARSLAAQINAGICVLGAILALISGES
jgi:hypothetical protein